MLVFENGCLSGSVKVSSILPESALLGAVQGFLLYIIFTISHNAISSLVSACIEYISCQPIFLVFTRSPHIKRDRSVHVCAIVLHLEKVRCTCEYA